MKKKLLIFLLLLIVGAIGIYSLTKKEDSPDPVIDYEINTQFKELELDWNDVYTFELSGNEGQTILAAKQGEIPEFEERREKAEEFLTEDEMIEVRKNEDKDFCIASVDTGKLRNGDEVLFNCDNKTLALLGYKASDNLIYKVENLGAEIIQSEPIKEEIPEKVEVTDRVIVDEKGYTNDGTENVYWYYGDFVMISPSDIGKIQTDNLERDVDYVVITAESMEEKEQIMKRANDGEIYIDQIILDGNVYYKEDNFQEGEPWKGIAL